MIPASPSSPAQRLFAASGMGSAHVAVDGGLVSTLLEKHYGLSGRLRPVATEKDDTFRLATGAGGFLVKVSPPDEPPEVVALQTAAMRFLELEAAELPVQRVRLTADGQDHVVLEASDRGTRILRVFDFVDGQVWAEQDLDADQLAKVGAMLGRVDVALERFTHPADRRTLVWDLRHFHTLWELVEHTPSVEQRRCAEAVLRMFESAVVPRLGELESQVIHGDYSPYNVVVDQSDDLVTAVIDFGDTMRSAVIFDPAVPMANLLGRTPDQPWLAACAFAAGYVRTRPIRELELPLLPVAALARLTLRALIANWRAERAPERRDYILAHARDDWTNLERSLAASLDDVIVQLGAASS